MLMRVVKYVFLALLIMPRLGFCSENRLALELAEDGDWAGACIEFRRLALESGDADAKSGYYWAAAYSAWLAGQAAAAGLLLDRAEDASAVGAAGLLLRALAAESMDMPKEAAFYYQGITMPDAAPEAVSFASRKLASLHLRQGDPEGAARALAGAPEHGARAAAALRQYQAGRDKSPLLGGALGLIPGMGYVYAGEYANAVRSLILNGIFIAGMFAAAEQDAWGVFAVIGFFEATWYSGSIYGGLDAAHRYNRGRREACINSLNADSGFEPDWSLLPIVFLRFSF